MKGKRQFQLSDSFPAVSLDLGHRAQPRVKNLPSPATPRVLKVPVPGRGARRGAVTSERGGTSGPVTPNQDGHGRASCLLG